MAARTCLLTAGAFTVGTSGYIVSGVLPAVSRELDVSVATAGQLLTAFAIAYAIGSPLLAAATGRWERRTLLVVALAVSGVGNALAAVAPNYQLLLASRVISALGAAVYTPGATLVATVLSPPEQRGRAVATVFGGLSLSLILGVPAGSLLGDPLGYRGVFALVALVSFLAAVGVRFGLPRVAAPPVIGLRARVSVAADRRVLLVLAITVLVCVSVFSVFGYVKPLLAATTGASAATVSLLLVAYGVGAVAGNVVGGRLTDRYGSRLLMLLMFAGLVLVLATLPLTAVTVPGAAIALFSWGFCAWGSSPAIQHWLIDLSPANSGLLLSLNASAIYLGVGLAGAVGGLVINWAGVWWLAPITSLAAATALVLLLVAPRVQRSAERTPSSSPG
jgi:predicted MFS family arabinose efflux permease